MTLELPGIKVLVDDITAAAVGDERNNFETDAALGEIYYLFDWGSSHTLERVKRTHEDDVTS